MKLNLKSRKLKTLNIKYNTHCYRAYLQSNLMIWDHINRVNKQRLEVYRHIFYSEQCNIYCRNYSVLLCIVQDENLACFLYNFKVLYGKQNAKGENLVQKQALFCPLTSLPFCMGSSDSIRAQHICKDGTSLVDKKA